MIQFWKHFLFVHLFLFLRWFVSVILLFPSTKCEIFTWFLCIFRKFSPKSKIYEIVIHSTVVKRGKVVPKRHPIQFFSVLSLSACAVVASGRRSNEKFHRKIYISFRVNLLLYIFLWRCAPSSRCAGKSGMREAYIKFKRLCTRTTTGEKKRKNFFFFVRQRRQCKCKK